MSGGHWDYSRYFIEDAEAIQRISATNLFMAAAEKALDWGFSCDTCIECAKLRVMAGLIAFFDDQCIDASRAIALIRDFKQNICARCLEREG